VPERVGFKVLPIPTKSRLSPRGRPEALGEQQEPPRMYAGEVSAILTFHHWTTGMAQQKRMCLMLDLSFGTANCLWNAGVSVECGSCKAYIKAPDLYDISGSASIIRPSPRSATINFYRLVLRGNHHILLDGWKSRAYCLRELRSQGRGRR
jgi:hypothetical protein